MKKLLAITTLFLFAAPSAFAFTIDPTSSNTFDFNIIVSGDPRGGSFDFYCPSGLHVRFHSNGVDFTYDFQTEFNLTEADCFNMIDPFPQTIQVIFSPDNLDPQEEIDFSFGSLAVVPGKLLGANTPVTNLLAAVGGVSGDFFNSAYGWIIFSIGIYTSFWIIRKVVQLVVASFSQPKKKV